MSALSDVLTELQAIRKLLEAKHAEEDVWTIDELSAHLKIARRTIEKLRRARAFPFPEITVLKDKRPR